MASASAWHLVLRRFEMVPAWVRLSISLVLAGVAYRLVPPQWHAASRVTAAWDAFALSTLVLTWAIIPAADVVHIRRVANREDPGRRLTFVFLLVAAVASLLAVVLLLGSIKEVNSSSRIIHIVLAVVAVLTAWLLVHTVFTLRYAHLYYDEGPGGQAGGLEFPGGEKEPDYLDFAYYAFVIGMTAQTADISISGRAMRRLTLLHGLLAFAFNTAIVALSINGLAGLL
ncbi:protein of unknown function DUF1345 [Hymenobacter roseosalivarius DSM 11622]|uniref:DUF1345 domain-containing protein n=1 Tax=Hymenobacter roseosalivarius DSM 11622 TaxID=645990 RepID=A0A1W1V3S8_9BACT|nr:DUF1345 domain-containing protein [Hymenobacter roseosalivarius]SMB87982.1 protein of unknown function DUF1345 [Hymenobacter roseosalivarius DSM 11622]